MANRTHSFWMSSLSLTCLFVGVSGCRDISPGVTCTLPTEAGDPVVTPCSQTIVLADAGNGFRPQPPNGSQCHGEQRYSFDLEDGAFDWVSCSFSTTEPWRRTTGTRRLSAAESAQLTATLAEVALARAGEGCGADKPTLTIDVSTSQDTQHYTDSFYSCSDPAGSYVNGIDPVFQLARELAQK